jgi:uncharacterized protein with PhoU and TrkA domain
MKKIIIASKHKVELAKEFGVSVQSIRMSLEYVFNSDKAKSIRTRAKELLLEQANSITE